MKKKTLDYLKKNSHRINFESNVLYSNYIPNWYTTINCHKTKMHLIKTTEFVQLNK